MDKDVTQAQKAASGKDDTDAESPELQELYAQLAEAVSSWHTAMRTAKEKNSNNDSKKLRELDQQVDAILARINNLMG